MTTCTTHSARRGVTLIEAVLFISVALGLIVGGLVVFQQAQLTARTNDAARALSAIASEVRAFYNRQDDFTGLTARVLSRAVGVPVEAGTEDPFLWNEWGGRLLVGTNPVGVNSIFNVPQYPRGTFFEIEYRDVPEGACARLARAKEGVGAFGPGLVAIRFARAVAAPAPNASGWTTITGGPTFNENGLLTVTPDQAAAACSAVNPRPINVRFTLTR